MRFSQRRSTFSSAKRWLLTLLLLLPIGGCSCDSERLGAKGTGRRTARASAAELEEVKRRLADRSVQDKAAAEAAKQAAVQQAAEKAAAKVAPTSAVPTPVASAAGAPPPPPPTPKVEPSPKPPPKPARPEDFGQWKLADYLTARFEGDPRLLAAVKYLATERVGDAAAAQVVAALLTRSDREATQRGAAKSNPALIRAVIGALYANGTPPARASLEQLLCGQFPTDDDQLATSATLELMTGRPTPEMDAILLKTLVQPQSWAGPAPGQAVDRLAVGPQVLAALKASASEEGRLKLAEVLMRESLPEALRPPLQEFLLERQSANLAAQAALFAWPKLPVALRRHLEQSFILDGSDAMRSLLGVAPQHANLIAAMVLPTKPIPRGLETLRDDPGLPARVEEHLWNDQFLLRLNESILRLERLEDDKIGAIALGSSVPRDATRAALYEALQHTWQDGPKVLQDAGVGTRTFCDPGLIFTLKALSRKPNMLAPKSRSSARPTTPRSKSLKLSEEQTTKLDHQWRQYMLDVMKTYSARLETVATPVRLSGGEAGETLDPAGAAGRPLLSQEAARAGLPLELHSDARIVGRYDLRWPRDTAATGQNLRADWTELHYIRIQQTTSRLRALINHYRNELGNAGEILITEKGIATSGSNELGRGVWLDGRPRPTTAGRKRVMNVVIMRPQTGPPPAADAPERLTIEVLTIEMNSPSDD